MEAIKKKMQAMKVEKDNACDRVDVCEEACKAARLRASKGEDEVDELMTKSRQLETELDLTAEKLGIATLQLEEKEKQLSATELEMAALQRRVSGLEEDLEKTETKRVAAEDEQRISGLEKELKEAREKAEAADNSFDELSRSWSSASLTSRRPRSGRRLERPRLLSLRRSSAWLPTTSSHSRLLRRRPTRGRRPTRSRSRP